jgi:hypothetical protein
MKHPSNCHCGSHNQHKRLAAYNNTTIVPEREHIGSTYGDEQKARQHRMHEERRAKGIAWRGTPSEEFDWDRAIEGLRRILREVYGE